MNDFYKKVTELLRQHGYSLDRQGKGSHEVWSKNGSQPVTVPSNLKSRHTGNKILKDAGIKSKI